MPKPVSESDRVAGLIEKSLNGLPERDRAKVVRFLLRSWLDRRFDYWTRPPGVLQTAVFGAVPAAVELAPTMTPMSVAPGSEQQTFPVRLPEEQHAALKAWCSGHGYSMATVVRGLVENFLRAQQPPGTGAATD